jgi:hypothetical protein
VIGLRMGISKLDLLTRISHFLTALNIMCNFYIYCLTVLSFREFIKSKVLAVWQCLRRTLCRQFLSNRNERRREGDQGIVMENLATETTSTRTIATCSSRV